MSISFLISVVIALVTQDLTDVDLKLSILEHLIVIATTVITSYIMYKKRK